MTNSDINSNFLMKLAVQKCMDEEIAAFDRLDTSDVIISDKTKRKIKNALLIQKIKDAQILKYMRRTAVAIMLVVTVTFATTMCIQPVRAAFWDAVVKWYENYISVQFVDDETEYPKKIEKRMLPTYLPVGWTLEVFDEDSISGLYDINGMAGEWIGYEQMTINNDDTWVDNTDCTVSEIMVNDVQACLITYEDESYTLLWTDQYDFLLTSENVALDVLLDIAESIK